MSRPLRIHAPGVAAHVVSRGNDRQPIFLDAADYERYLVLLGNGLKRFHVTCHALCLLWNHVHLVITPDIHPIWRLMQQVNSKYCEDFNGRHHRVGHVLQGRYFCQLVDDGSYFLNAVRYVALNPVAAGKVKRPEDWPWSSYRALMAPDPLPDYLDVGQIFHWLDADTEQEMRDRLRTFVEAGDATEGRHILAGSKAFVTRMHPLIAAHRRDAEYAYVHRYATRPSLASLFADVEGPALEAAAASAFVDHGSALREIARALGDWHPSTIWRRIHRTRTRTQASASPKRAV